MILSGVDYLCTTSGMFPHSALHPFLQSFQCRHGKAYLFDEVQKMCLVTVSYNMLSFCKSAYYVLLLYWHCSVNVTLGEKEERMMLTGMHTVVDIFCVGCGSIVGWKYEAAQEKDQKYKEGRFILESNYSILQDAQLGRSDTDEP
ncbi:hypothetical protein RDI58_021332 [Solanum bulbocastanum]|uniref:Protein yippee-like n=1 Tax=Solanum bulbocastanum TaxID=147425 RepID=A0AAN8T059_SOLBU